MEFDKEKKSLDMLASAAVGGASASVLAVLLLSVTAALTHTVIRYARFAPGITDSRIAVTMVRKMLR